MEISNMRMTRVFDNEVFFLALSLRSSSALSIEELSIKTFRFCSPLIKSRESMPVGSIQLL